jgi:nucleoside-diphosphate-sugar epimerase
VSGATSQLGVFLLPHLLAANFRVLALSRHAPSRPLQIRAGLFWTTPGASADGGQDAADSRPLAPDCLVSCGPLEVARELVLRFPGLRRVVAFSSSSVLSKALSGDPGERRLMASMAADEDALAHCCAERGIPLLLLRPTMIYGCGKDHNVSTLAHLARHYRVIPLAGPASGLRQPVHADDLAVLAVRALQSNTPLDTASAACGGSTLTFREMARRVAAAEQPQPARLVTLPESLMALLVGILSRLPGSPGINVEMVRRQNRNLVFDDSPLREALAWSPRPFQPTPADFEVPEHCRILQLP